MIVSNKHPAIAKEGWLNISISVALLFICVFLQNLLAVFFVFLTGFLLFLYRDPIRKIPAAPLGIVSPVDGKILSIDHAPNQYCDEPSYKISIQSNRLGVFAIRSPIEGKIHKQTHVKKSDEASFMNWVRTDEGDNIIWEVAVRSRTNAHCYVQPGERIGQGQRCGFLAFNSHVDLYIPANSTLNLKVNELVKAGESIIGYLVHNQGASIGVESALSA